MLRRWNMHCASCTMLLATLALPGVGWADTPTSGGTTVPNREPAAAAPMAVPPATAAATRTEVAGAKPESPLEVLSPRELTIPRPRKGQSCSEIVLPARIIRPELAGKLRVQTISVVRDQDWLSSDIVGFELRYSQESPTTPELIVKIDADRTQRAGTYRVTMHVLEPVAETTPAPPGKVSPRIAHSLEFSFSRPVAELRVHSPLHLHSVIYLPLPGVWCETSTGSVVLSEVRGKSEVTPEACGWQMELHDSKGALAEGRVAVTFPREIEAGKQGTLQWSLEGTVPLGKSTGTLLVRAPQLETEKLETSVEIERRLWSGWLLAIIAAGIVAGYRVRVLLENRRLRGNAELGALRQLSRLRKSREEAIDQELRGELAKFEEQLDALLRDPSTTASQLTEETTRIEQAADQAKQKSDNARRTLMGKLAEYSTNLGKPIGQPEPIRAVLNRTLDELQEAQRELERGSKRLAQDVLSALDAALILELQVEGGKWLGEISEAIRRIGDWPETSLPTLFSELNAAIHELRQALESLDGAAKIRALLPRFAQLQVRVERQLVPGGGRALADAATEVLEKLSILSIPELAPRIADLQKEWQTIRQTAEGTGVKLLPFASAIEVARKRLKDAIAAAVPAPTPEKHSPTPTGLADGHWFQAIEQVMGLRGIQIAAPTERKLGGHATRRFPQTTATILPGIASPSPAPPDMEADVSTWAITIEVPADRIVAPSTFSLRARLFTSPGRTVPNLRLRWFVNSVVAQESGLGEGLLVQARQPGPIVIECLATDTSSQEQKSYRLRLEASADHSPTIQDVHANLETIRWQQTCVAGALLAIIGYSIFKTSFIGALEDVWTAFLWGFTTDIGLAKVMDLAAPLQAKTPPGRTAG